MKLFSALESQVLLIISLTFFLQDDQLLEDSKTLGDCGFTNQTARPQAPATVGLAFRVNGKYCSTNLLLKHKNTLSYAARIRRASFF